MRIFVPLLFLSLRGGANALTAQSFPEPGPPVFGWQAGAGLGTPLKGAVTVVLMRGQAGGVDGWWGENVVLDAGLGGGKVRLGRYSYGANAGREYGLALLHTWGEPWQVAPGQTFLGGEVQLGALPLTLSLGGFVRVRGDAPGDAFLFSAALGARLLPLFWPL
jgi:hypothetical protein